MGYPSALSRQDLGLLATCCSRASRSSLPQPFGSYVMENVLFKISYPAEFHAQTAVEAAMALHPQVHGRLGEIERIVIETQEPGVRIIDKTGPLANPADRDHCIQYMVAVPLIFGRLTAADYEDDGRRAIRASMRCARKMQVRENPKFTQEYYAAGQALHRQRRAGVLQGRQRHASAWRWSSPSATAGAAPRACRCW